MDQIAEKILEITREAYQVEFERRNVVDTKAGIALPIAISYEIVLLADFNLHDILLIKFNSFEEFLLPCGLFVFYVAALILGFIAIVFGGLTLKPTKYQLVSQNVKSNLNQINQDTVMLYAKLCDKYDESTQYNKEKNDRKFDLYNAVWTSIIISLACYIVYIAIENIFC